MMIDRDFRMLIGGRLVPGAARLAVENPATGDIFAEAPDASPADLDAAVAAARGAFPAGATRRSRRAARRSSRLPTG